MTGFDGFVSVASGTNKVSSNGTADSANANSLRGTFAFTHQTGFGLQLDNSIDNQTVAILQSVKMRSSDLALHGFYRSNDYLVGLMHQTRTFKIGGINGQSITMPVDRTFSGFEGQYHFDNVTLYGQTASDRVNVYLNGITKGRTNFVEARYFFNSNLRADASYGESKLDNVNANSRVKTSSVGLEYKLDNSPFSFFGKYQDMRGTNLDTKRFLIGAQFNFGQGSLSDRNRSGASLNTIGADNMLLNQFN
ncbi:hypothetical protein [Limnohabitans sp. Jir72]|uniref:hypothetical protein n=1 Tax=Limnohabitans sp. Jir72 TaxID=1977909 RepID=UPI00130503EB|nr:hypothetical protein [Limnohabitans sp. Jir72]